LRADSVSFGFYTALPRPFFDDLTFKGNRKGEEMGEEEREGEGRDVVEPLKTTL